jgi:mannose-6-phosphate isomerase-like protein (cupin superfamily)
LTEVRVHLRKPEAIAKAAAASVQVSRSPSDFPRRLEDTRWGQAEVLLETKDAGLYLLHVEAGQEIPRHHHQVMRELEWLVDGELFRENHEVEAFTPVSWDKGQIHSYRNNSESRATLFCCDCPPFMPQDEIEVGGDR